MRGIIAMRAMRTHLRWSLIVATAVGLLLLLPSSVLAQGGPNEKCSTSLIAKFEARGPNFVFEKGTEGVITIVNIETDDDGEPVSFDWSATTEVGSVIVKGGQETTTFSGDTSSIVFGSPPAISNVQFCAPDEVTDTDEGDDETTDDSKDDTTDDSEDETTGDGTEASDVADQKATNATGDIAIPTRVDTGAGGSSRRSFETIIVVLTVVFFTATGVTVRLIRRRG
jgi:hypothetical protein